MIITIDGPAASGKSTVARRLACELSCYYLYSGLLYRAMAYLLVKHYGYTRVQLEAPVEAHICEILVSGRLCYTYTVELGAQVFFDGVDCTPLLKTREVDDIASISSTALVVREAVLHLQRTLARDYDLIADGRDCGTVVFPEAHHKFFLMASPQIRAQRWHRDQQRLGKQLTFDEALAAVVERDERDTKRALCPLVIPQGAFVVNNSDLTLEETVTLFRQYCASEVLPPEQQDIQAL